MASIDSLLAEVEGSMGPTTPAPAAAAPKKPAAPAPKPAARVTKCAVATLTPPDEVMYRCTAMRCTKCDFDVVFKDDWGFADGVDYQFTRYYYPDWKRLEERMRRLPGLHPLCVRDSTPRLLEIESLPHVASFSLQVIPRTFANALRSTSTLVRRVVGPLPGFVRVTKYFRCGFAHVIRVPWPSLVR